MFGALDISTSALVAQRTRMEIISANIANREAIYDANGNYNPFRRRIAMFAPGDPTTGNSQGVHVSRIELDQAPFRKVYDPGHPSADEQGYLGLPNIDPAYEMINAIDAKAAYDANITAAEATKSMMQSALRLLA